MNTQNGCEHYQSQTPRGAETAWGQPLSPYLSYLPRAYVPWFATYVVDEHLDDREKPTDYLRAEGLPATPGMGGTPRSAQKQERQE